VFEAVGILEGSMNEFDRLSYIQSIGKFTDSPLRYKEAWSVQYHGDDWEDHTFLNEQLEKIHYELMDSDVSAIISSLNMYEKSDVSRVDDADGMMFPNVKSIYDGRFIDIMKKELVENGHEIVLYQQPDYMNSFESLLTGLCHLKGFKYRSNYMGDSREFVESGKLTQSLSEVFEYYEGRAHTKIANIYSSVHKSIMDNWKHA
jgi:hypothetical protein